MGAGSSYWREGFGQKYKKGAVTCTEPAKTRPGKDFPGGRALRRAKRALALRQKTFTPDSGSAKRHKRTYPGSLQA